MLLLHVMSVIFHFSPEADIILAVPQPFALSQKHRIRLATSHRVLLCTACTGLMYVPCLLKFFIYAGVLLIIWFLSYEISPFKMCAHTICLFRHKFNPSTGHRNIFM
jgi:hypothetical protein